MSRRTRSNPDWSDAIAQKNCAAIRQACREFDLPMPLLDDKCEIEGELGAGLYGAVYKTEDPGVVFKIASDVSEAHFVALLIAMREKDGIDPKGMVKYHAILGLNGKRDFEGSKLPTFAIWREAANDVGLKAKKSSSCEIKEFEKLIKRYYDHADEAFFISEEAATNMPINEYWAWMKVSVDAANSILDGKKLDIPLVTPKFSRYLAEAYRVASQMMENTKSYYVGESLMTYLRKGVLVGDLHLGNIGVFKFGRCGEEIWKIFDPGHSCILKQSLSQIEIPLIGGAK